MEFPGDLRYTKDHEWLRLEGNDGIVGITDFAQDALGDVVFVELPTVGATLTRGQTFGVVESNKTVSDLFAPVSGRVQSRVRAGLKVRALRPRRSAPSGFLRLNWFHFFSPLRLKGCS